MNKKETMRWFVASATLTSIGIATAVAFSVKPGELRPVAISRHIHCPVTGIPAAKVQSGEPIALTDLICIVAETTAVETLWAKP